MEKQWTTRTFSGLWRTPSATKLTRPCQRSSWSLTEFSQSGWQSFKKVHLSRNKSRRNYSFGLKYKPNLSFMRKTTKAHSLSASLKRLYLAQMTSLSTHSRRTIRIRYSKSLNAIVPKYFKLKIKARTALNQKYWNAWKLSKA